ncbi:SMP-30/gluconolactonase/LRE family protein [Streptomyces sp. NPDC101132]|uniref:SMP-30/gluconolactonase/LRE family protein n=1 Tax=Streptomyces sp. NPDC101132 TaxID=3366110 RepID=UPI003818324E
MRFRTLAATTTALLATALPALTPTTALARPADHRTAPAAPTVTTAYGLPGAAVYPEGIAADPYTGAVYAGSYADGTVYRAIPGRPTAEVFLPAGTDGRRTANGLKADPLGRLWVTDSTKGVAVYDVRTRRLLARFDVPGTAPRFVNDVALAPDGTAYLTDSVREVVYRVTPADFAYARTHGGTGELTPRYDLSGTLEPHPAGTFTLNGIVADPAGRYLLVVDMTGGDLYRIGLRDGTVRAVALTGADMAHADGLDLRHGTLRVAHNTVNTLTRWQLNHDGTAARLVRTFTDPSLEIPTTLVHTRGRTLVVRSQFDKGGPLGAPGTPGPFTIAAVTGL